MTDLRWKKYWEQATDLERLLLFPLLNTTKNTDLNLWEVVRKIRITLELTGPREENIVIAQQRNEKKYEKFIVECREQGWAV